MTIPSIQIRFVPKLDEVKRNSTAGNATLGGGGGKRVENGLELGGSEREIGGAKVEPPCHGCARGEEPREGVESGAHGYVHSLGE